MSRVEANKRRLSLDLKGPFPSSETSDDLSETSNSSETSDDFRSKVQAGMTDSTYFVIQEILFVEVFEWRI